MKMLENARNGGKCILRVSAPQHVIYCAQCLSHFAPTISPLLENPHLQLGEMRHFFGNPVLYEPVFHALYSGVIF